MNIQMEITRKIWDILVLKFGTTRLNYHTLHTGKIHALYMCKDGEHRWNAMNTLNT